MVSTDGTSSDWANTATFSNVAVRESTRVNGSRTATPDEHYVKFPAANILSSIDLSLMTQLNMVLELGTVGPDYTFPSVVVGEGLQFLVNGSVQL